MAKKKNIPIIGVIWKVVFKAFKKDPVILVPFCISGALKLLGLLVVFLSIFYPLSVVFAPIIKTIWGEAFLHYPFNFHLMPRLFYYVQIGVYILIDGLLSGIAVWMIYQSNEGKSPKLFPAVKKALSKYLTIAGFMLSIFLIMYLISFAENFLILRFIKTKAVVFLMKNGWLDVIKVFFNFFIIILIEIWFAFVIPFTVLEDKRFFKSLWSSFSLARKFFLTTLLLIFIPMLISLPFSLLKAGIFRVMDITFPGITFVVLGLGVVFMAVVDSIVTASLTFLFLSRKEL